MLKLTDTIEINNNKLTKKYIESLNYKEREALIDPIFNFFRSLGFPQPTDKTKLNKEYKRLLDKTFDLATDEIFNNSSVATYICHYFCWNEFYSSKEVKSKSVIEVFNDDDLLKKIISNRLGMDWLLDDDKGPGVNESFNFTVKQIITGARSSRKAPAISMFKPEVAKFLYEKYSNEGDLVHDYSAGFGGRLLGAVSCNRKYIATDPLTIDCLKDMVNYFDFKNVILINSGSENYKLKENSVDFSFSSPPYYNQEIYALNSSQAYNNGEDYFYNVYWKNTLSNIKRGLKPNKWFGLNITNKYTKMIDMAKEEFGEPIEIIKLKTVRSHLSKSAGNVKFEPVFMFKNKK